MPGSRVILDSGDRYCLAGVSEVRLGVPSGLQGMVWLHDGIGYRVADRAWKKVSGRCSSRKQVRFSVQFTQIGPVELVVSCHLQQVDSPEVIWAPEISFSVEVSPPFAHPLADLYTCDVAVPVQPRLVIESDLLSVLDSDSSPPVVWLSGPPCVGKTTLLTRLFHAPGHGHTSRYIDMMGVNDLQEVYGRVAQCLSNDYERQNRDTDEDVLLRAVDDLVDGLGSAQDLTLVLDNSHNLFTCSGDPLLAAQTLANIAKTLVNRFGEQDKSVHLIIADRVPLTVIAERFEDLYRTLETVGTVQVPRCAELWYWNEKEMQGYLTLGGRFVVRFVYQWSVQHGAHVVNELMRVSGGHAALINAYLHSVKSFYGLLDHEAPWQVDHAYREELRNAHARHDLVGETVCSVACQISSLLTDHERQLFLETMGDDRCDGAPDRCWSTRRRCSLDPGLERLKSLGIWRADSGGCPLGSPLIGKHLLDVIRG